MERVVNLKEKLDTRKNSFKSEDRKTPASVDKIAEPAEKNAEAPEISEPLSVSWQAPEYEHYEKSADWFWAVAIITIGFLTLAFIFKNIILGVLIFMLGFVVMLYGAKKPRLAKFLINYRGLTINSKFFPYDNLKSFWLNYDPPEHKELLVISKKIFMPRLSIPLENTDPNKIREILIKYLEEKYEEKALSDVLAKLFKF